ncbi:hypothetical protein N9917_01385 [Deltaproteobacteria bacterium]|nr:hypothetical protein [Deltaproteobacteria bacterium]
MTPVYDIVFTRNGAEHRFTVRQWHMTAWTSFFLGLVVGRMLWA